MEKVEYVYVPVCGWDLNFTGVLPVSLMVTSKETTDSLLLCRLPVSDSSKLN